MSTHHGKEGVVKFGANTVAEVTEFTVEEEIDTADTTVMGSVAKTHKPGIPGWSGSLSCFWDEDDTTGQAAATIGASLTTNLYPEGTATGAKYLSGTATITGVSVGVAKDGIDTRTIQFLGNGALSHATAS